MKKILLILLLFTCFGLGATPNVGYSIKVVENESVLTEVQVSSSAELEDMIEKLSQQFPQADRIEIDPSVNKISV